MNQWPAIVSRGRPPLCLTELPQYELFHISPAAIFYAQRPQSAKAPHSLRTAAVAAPGLFHFSKKERPQKAVCQSIMASPARFELTTFRLGGGRSIQLSYGDNIYIIPYPPPFFNACTKAFFCGKRQNSRGSPLVQFSLLCYDYGSKKAWRQGFPHLAAKERSP